MHDRARPKPAAGAGPVPGVRAAARGAGPFSPRPSSPRPPAQRRSRRVQPSHSRFGDPRMRNMHCPPLRLRFALAHSPWGAPASATRNPKTPHRPPAPRPGASRSRGGPAPPRLPGFPLPSPQARRRPGAAGAAMSTEAAPPPAWPELNAPERRVLGVLVEKMKTTPDVYPLSVNSLVTGCNQKSNRDPVLTLTDLDV